jgi:hypothetical protein
VGYNEAADFHHSKGGEGLMGEGEVVGCCTALNGGGETAAGRQPGAAAAWSKEGEGEDAGPVGWLAYWAASE